jgi:hypothetical protein
MAARVARVLCLGSGPFTRSNMTGFLENMGMPPLAIHWKVPPGLLVCGRRNIHEGRVHALLREPRLRPVVCAQEHVLFCFARLQEQTANNRLLTVSNHPVKRWLALATTNTEDSTFAAEVEHSLPDIFRPGDLLRILSYVDCAIYGTQARRRKLLRQAFVSDLVTLGHLSPTVQAPTSTSNGDVDSAVSWGTRRSPRRLRHLAASLLHAVRTPASLNTPLRTICRKDLHWLRVNVYRVGGFDFPWPSL